MNGMILAAGLGTRFRPHTSALPKPALPFLNLPLLYYALAIARTWAPQKVVINTHHLPHAVTRLCAELPTIAPNIAAPTLLHESGEILGNAGGIKNAQAHLEGGDFFVLNADTVILPLDGAAFVQAQRFHQQNKNLATLMVMEHPEVGKTYGGVWADAQGIVRGFGKTAPAAGLKGYHFYGVRILSPEVFAHIPLKPCDIFRDVLVHLLEQERVRVFVAPVEFFDGGQLSEYLADSARALRLLETNQFLRQTLTTFGRPLQRVGAQSPVLPSWNLQSVLIGNHVKIDPSASLKGFCILGDGVEISAHCQLENVVVRAGLHVAAQSICRNDLLL